MTGHALLRRNLDETLRRFLVLLTALSLGASLVLVASGAVGQGAARSASALDTASALTVLELDSVDPRGPAAPLSQVALAGIRRLSGVEDVRAYAQFGVTLMGDQGSVSPGAFWATPMVPWVQPQVTASVPGLAPGHPLAADEVYAPDTRAGTTGRALLGRRLRMQYTRATGPAAGEGAELSVRVVGLSTTPGPVLMGSLLST